MTQQITSVHKDLLAFQAKTEQRFDAVDRKFAAVDTRFDQVDGRLDRLDTGLRRLREEMPGIVDDAVRTVMRGRLDHRSSARKAAARKPALGLDPTVAAGPPEAVVKEKRSYTRAFLKAGTGKAGGGGDAGGGVNGSK